MLARKLRRDLLRLKGQSVAIALLVALAVAVFVGSMTTHRSLDESRQRYYALYRFADVFDSLSAAPNAVAASLRQLPGVVRCETRLVANASLTIENFDESITARVYSLPGGKQPQLNRLYLRSGRLPDSGDAQEVVIGENFAQAQTLRLDQFLTAVIEGKSYRLKIVGVALSPEFIYQVRPGAMMPDDKRFTVMWVGDELVAGAMGLRHAFNDVSLELRPGAIESDVIASVDRVLAPFGGLGAYGREQQISHRFLTDELTQLESTAVVVPALFLAVATFLLNVILGRIIALQREQIATLKALGFSRWTIATHYSVLGSVIIICGSLAGAVGGWAMGIGMTTMYAGYYRIPIFRYGYDADVLIIATLLSLGASLTGTLGSIRRVLQLQPAEAMRPPAPRRFRRGWLESTTLGQMLSIGGRMILRQMLNNPFRSAFSILGVASAVAILIVGMFYGDAFDHVINLQFRNAQREDVTVALAHPMRRDLVLAELEKLPGVTKVEAQRELPVKFLSGPRSHRSGIAAFARGSALRRVLDAQGRVVTIPDSGILMSSTLADVLQVKPGQQVTLEILDGKRGQFRARVAQLVEDAFGASAYADINWLNDLVDGAPRADTALLRVESASRPALLHRLQKFPKILAVSQRLDVLRSFEQVGAEMILFFAGVLTLFGAAIAGGVVYNVARIALAERERDLGTLRVIGFTRREVGRVVLHEIAIVVAAALPVGCALGWLMAQGAATSMQTDLYRIPATIYPSTYLFSMFVVIVTSALVAWVVRRRVNRLDLMGVLKNRE